MVTFAAFSFDLCELGIRRSRLSFRNPCRFRLTTFTIILNVGKFLRFRQTICKLALLVPALTLTAGILTASPSVVMKVLVLSMNQDDDGYQSITTMLDQVG